jgi:hypothetical protein
MPLSEHEERILAEIERQLAAEDPRFASRSRRAVGSIGTWSRTLRLRLAIGLAIVGVLCILGLAAHIAFAAVGMVMLLAAIIVGATAVRERLQPETPRTPSRDDAV